MFVKRENAVPEPASSTELVSGRETLEASRLRVRDVPGDVLERVGDKEHRVPLSNPALVILGKLPRDATDGAVFSGRSAGGFLNQDAMADVLAKLSPGFTVHGFRSTFRDWAAETTGYPNHASKWRWHTRSRTASRPPTAAATCSKSGNG